MAIDFPVHVSFDGIERDEALAVAVRDHVEHLPRHHSRIHGCRVVVGTDAHHATGSRYRVHLRVELPGKDVVVGQHPPRPGHDDPYLAVADAFRTVERRLDDAARILRGEVKTHEDAQAIGRVTRLSDDGEHGFLETADGREVYFHRNSVLDGFFDELEPGAKLRFVEEEGERGPQASTVHVL
jgi:cold shock CspA family protein